MKTHLDVKGLLEHYSRFILNSPYGDLKKETIEKTVEHFMCSNNLNQAEPEPLTNNKGNGNKCEHNWKDFGYGNVECCSKCKDWRWG